MAVNAYIDFNDYVTPYKHYIDDTMYIPMQY
jgi:hypothetical protein